MLGCGARTGLWEATNGAGAPFGAGANSGGNGGNPSPGGGNAAIGGTSNGDDAGSGATGGASLPWVARGDQKLIDLFVGKLGIYVVFEDSVVLYGRSGAELTRVPTKGRAIAAAFDGQYLSVGSEGTLIITYSLDLNSQFVSQTKLDCVSLALVFDHRGVCGSNAFSIEVYDVLGGSQLGSLGMVSSFVKRVPGSDDFITTAGPLGARVDALTEGRVLPDGSLTFLRTWGTQVGRSYGFDGVPAARVITGLGQIFELGCPDPCPSSPLRPDSPGQFIAFDSVAANETFALHDADPDSASDDNKMYTIDELDVVARKVVLRQPVGPLNGYVLALRRDPRGQSILLGTRLNPGGSARGYELHSVPVVR